MYSIICTVLYVQYILCTVTYICNLLFHSYTLAFSFVPQSRSRCKVLFTRKRNVTRKTLRNAYAFGGNPILKYKTIESKICEQSTRIWEIKRMCDAIGSDRYKMQIKRILKRS